MDNLNKLNLDLLKDVVPFATLPTLAQLNLMNNEVKENKVANATSCALQNNINFNQLTTNNNLNLAMTKRSDLSRSVEPFSKLTNSSPLPSLSSQLIIKSELNKLNLVSCETRITENFRNSLSCQFARNATN